ncbi:hypothetical protein [Methylopila sp. M107]|uniref:hypothetical protein n=1 Tax=Methylopila sp. M107 TaxID=1101190 RepID=UPI00036DBD9A|nr:hypothetical protein [Methylopila sp. M107]
MAKTATKSALDEIEVFRDRINEVREAIEAAERAPVDLATVKERVAGFVDSQVDEAREWLGVSAFAGRQGAMGHLGDLQFGSAFSRAPFGVLAQFVGREAIQNKLIEMAAPSAAGGVGEGERMATVASRTRELGELERSEEAAIRALEEHGEVIIRRPDANPAIVLARDLNLVEAE